MGSHVLKSKRLNGTTKFKKKLCLGNNIRIIYILTIIYKKCLFRYAFPHFVYLSKKCEQKLGSYKETVCNEGIQ